MKPKPAPPPRCHVLKWPEHGVEMAFRLIPAGSFRMGSRGFHEWEEPAHLVKITRPFWLAETPVTQTQFALWTSSAGIQHKNGFPGNPDHPAENMDWRQANQYCAWLAKNQASKLPKGYALVCLPTEAEWEYACRAGTETDYYMGDGEAALAEAGWFDSNTGNSTEAVRQKKPNAFGLYDMHGNVWEWCHDFWDDAAYRKRLNKVEDPGAKEREEEWRHGIKKMLAPNADRALRGGSWVDSAGVCRSAYRVGFGPVDRYRGLGFRVCLVPGSSFAKASEDRPSAQPASQPAAAAARAAERRRTRDEDGVEKAARGKKSE